MAGKYLTPQRLRKIPQEMLGFMKFNLVVHSTTCSLCASGGGTQRRNQSRGSSPRRPARIFPPLWRGPFPFSVKLPSIFRKGRLRPAPDPTGKILGSRPRNQMRGVVISERWSNGLTLLYSHSPQLRSIPRKRCAKSDGDFRRMVFDTIQPETANCVYCSGSFLWMISSCIDSTASLTKSLSSGNILATFTPFTEIP